MERKIEQEFLQWKESPSRQPLLLHGARQVGKTYIVTKFGREHYAGFVYLNFESNMQLQSALPAKRMTR